jgi:S1-C subfamily serine protease
VPGFGDPQAKLLILRLAPAQRPPDGGLGYRGGATAPCDGRGPERGRGGGAGVIWNSDGVIVTNAHVARSPRTGIVLWDGRSLRA